MRYVAILLAAVASLSACSSGAGSGTETGGARPQQNLITAEGLAELRSVHNAYEAVRALRPQWMTPRPSRSATDPAPVVPVVFVDRMLLGELAMMRTVAVAEITEIRYFESGESVARFGRQYDKGVIQIISR
jgi:hypothetical protein